MAVYATMLLCAVGLAFLVYRYDMYEKEPVFLLLLSFGLGMGSGWVLGYAEDVVLVLLADVGTTIAGQAAVAAVMEESAKLLVVLLIAVVFSREFNDPLDGIVYGAIAGLGTAVEESFFYIGLSASDSVLPGTEAVRLLLHTLLGGVGGFGIGFARFRIRNWQGILPGWFAAAVTIHFFWDFLCGLPSRAGSGSEWTQRITAVVLMLIAMLLFGISVVIGSRLSRQMHAPKSRLRLWGWPFNNWFGRPD